MKPVLLLVDDNEDILKFLSLELSEKYTVIKSFNGQEALEALKANAIHLVICDIMMPVIDGLEFCKIIKTTIDYCHIPVILLTAKNDFQSKIEGLEHGADAYIEKPFSPEFLQVQIANLLANRSKIREHFANSPLVHIKSMAHTKADELFLDKLNECIYEHFAEKDFDVEKLANTMNMSRPTLYRKIKAISNLSPNELINIAKLKRAAELLIEGKYRIYEIANMLGYSSQANLTRSFLSQFGLTPTEYVNSKQIEKND